jgi:hypothetical protein
VPSEGVGRSSGNGAVGASSDGADGVPSGGADGASSGGADLSSGGADGRTRPLPGGEDGWSSDFGSGGSGRGADQDFASSSSQRPVPEHSAPRFGGFGDEQGGGGGVASEGRHDQQQGIADGDAGPTIGKALRTIIPVVVIVIVALVFFRSDFSLWWVVFVFVLPMLRRLGDMFRDNDRRR